MEEVIDFNSYPIKDVWGIILRDRTTGHKLLTTAGHPVTSTEKIMPRFKRDPIEKQKRTKKYAEVFTPSWICNDMNNMVDEEWFGRPDVFNHAPKQKVWDTQTKKIKFPADKTWQQYVMSNRLEITCGEAPFLVSRYNSLTGEMIPVKDRIGLLDRKLRIIKENTKLEREWVSWVKRAYHSVYGYDFQSDNVIMARCNLINTFVDYTQSVWHHDPTKADLEEIATIVSWNIWRMNGLTDCIPNTENPCVIMDWVADKKIYFKDIKKEASE